MKKTAIVIGAGCAGLISAKELKEQEFDVKIIEKNDSIGGIWSSLPWKTYTLTSSKWVTEYGCYPMPENYPDFVTNEHMLEYLESFAENFKLRPLIDFNVDVSAIEKNQDGSLNIVTNQRTYKNIDHIVLSTGLHGKPFIPELPGLTTFTGEVQHSSKYRNAESFEGKKVLCVGLGESGVGLVSELASVTDKLVVSSEGVAIAPRVVKGSQNPFDQMQFWQIGKYMIGYQELLTSGLSWFYRKIPMFLKKFTINISLKFYTDYDIKFEQFEKWFPKALVPHHFHVKYWAKPHDANRSGNLTRTSAPPDDIFYLIKTGKMMPKGKVKSFESNGVVFEDGSFEEVDTIIFNTGYKPGSRSITFPNRWEYDHAELFKGCIHAKIPNLAFVGMVRPTIGSIPAMAEMHARVVSAYFSGAVTLPLEAVRMEITKTDSLQHRCQCPHIYERFPHIYFFDDWMEKMAASIGAAPRLRDHLSSLEKLRGYFFGAPIPLRYRMRGPGKSENAGEIYLKRVNQVWNNAFGKWATITILTYLVLPYLISSLVFIGALKFFGLSAVLSLAAAVAFYALYRFVDLFRYLFEIGFAQTISYLVWQLLLRQIKEEAPNYDSPNVFQTLN